MRRRQEEVSSLELLLDTMCNTFGGVMFIAISLAVMLSMRSAVNAVPADTSAEIRAVQQRIAELQLELEQQKKQKPNFDDSRLEIIFLQQSYENVKRRQQLSEQKLKAAQLSLRDIREKNKKSTVLLQNAKELLNKLSRQQKDIFEKQKDMKGSPPEMLFSTMVKKETAPYFILMNNGKVWSIGPDINQTSYTPASAVDFKAEKGRYVCTPKPGEGTDIFDGEKLSSELSALLKKIPKDRIPEFVISPGDAATFFRLRELLKKQKIFHGFRLQGQDKNQFEYQFSNDSKGRYEY
jgi:hypothetical protein